MDPRQEFAAVILAGGAASRLSGVDKVMLEVGGKPLLRRAFEAVSAARPVVVVGPRRAVAEPVTWVREDPPGSGPLAALAAGITALPEDGEVAVLAGDLAGVTAGTIERLRAALAAAPELDGAVLVDAAGVRQWLIGVWRLPALRRVLPVDPANRPLRAALGVLRLIEVPARPGEAADVDTPGDLERASSQQSHR